MASPLHAVSQAVSPPAASSAPLMAAANALPAMSTSTIVLSAVAALLVLEQFVYRQKKQGLPGDKWTIPLIGKFMDSMNPTLEGYKKQWDLGALSALSVFNMYVSEPLVTRCFSG